MVARTVIQIKPKSTLLCWAVCCLSKILSSVLLLERYFDLSQIHFFEKKFFGPLYGGKQSLSSIFLEEELLTFCKKNHVIKKPLPPKGNFFRDFMFLGHFDVKNCLRAMCCTMFCHGWPLLLAKIAPSLDVLVHVFVISDGFG